MTSHDPKNMYREMIEQVWHRGDLDFIDEVYDPAFVGRVPRSGYQDLAAFRRYVAETTEGIPDLYFYVKDQIAEGDRLATRFQLTGTHTGNFLGIPPTRRPIDVEGVSIHRIRDGRFVESWTVWDVLGLCHEIGLVPELTELV